MSLLAMLGTRSKGPVSGLNGAPTAQNVSIWRGAARSLPNYAKHLGFLSHVGLIRLAGRAAFSCRTALDGYQAPSVVARTLRTPAKAMELNDVKPEQGLKVMKTAMMAAALIASASFAWADDDTTFSVIETSAAGAGQIEIVTKSSGEYTLTLVNCLPMKSAVLDQDNDLDDLSSNGSATLEEVVRGTLRHNIATYACSNG